MQGSLNRKKICHTRRPSPAMSAFLRMASVNGIGPGRKSVRVRARPEADRRRSWAPDTPAMRARPVILVYFLASRVAMKAGSPGLPSLVVTPSSHLVAISGWAATQSRAASRAFISGFSCMVTMMEFIMVTGTA